MKTLIKDLKSVMWLCRPYWKYGKLYMAVSIIVFALYSVADDVIYVKFPEVIINLLAEGRTFVYIAIIAAIIEAASFFRNILPRLFLKYFAKRKEEIGLKLKRNVYEKAVNIDYKYIDTPEYYNHYAWAVNEYAKQANAAGDFIINICKRIASIAALVSIIAAIGPWLLLIEVLQMALHAVINTRMNQNEIQEKSELMPVDRRLNYFHRLFYMKEYSSDMKATALKNRVFDGYDKAGRSKVCIRACFAGKDAFWLIVHEVVFTLAEGFIILSLIYGIVSGNIPEIGMYMTMLLAFYRIDCKLEELVDILQQANGLSLNAQKIKKFFDIKSEIEAAEPESGVVPSEGKFAVELRNVGFTYENSGFSLSKLNFTIKPGEKIAVVGENGAGKSTFVKLLLRLYDVCEGEILINGRSIREYDLHRLRQRIGVAFQNTNIYAMSFAENVSLYGEVPENVIKEMVERFDFGSIFEKNHAGCDTELTREFDEKGIMLSGGEAQKVALARVMCRNFGLILLDEPSSALDPIAEYKMNKMILDAADGTTTIMVSHRLSTVRNADRIILIDEGKIKESGTHDELMELKGKYYEMFTKQAENYIK